MKRIASFTSLQGKILTYLPFAPPNALEGYSFFLDTLTDANRINRAPTRKSSLTGSHRTALALPTKHYALPGGCSQEAFRPTL